jgi:REP element-mobilizing transposase RayT/phage antirepressor YoqD-like protein
MARTARKHLDGKYFHVMVQGIAKENIFPDDNSKGYYLRCLDKSADKKSISILGFCVMDNHTHLLLTAENISVIAQYMKIVNSEYARYYNNENDRVGYVFRDRFKSEVIQDVKYLIHCLVYIHNNPVKAHVVKRAEEYRYSSYTNYLTKRGIVNFKEASKHYDISSSNINEIMKERSHSDWIEHDDKKYEDGEEVLEELVKKYNVSSNKLEYDLAAKMAKELIIRCDLSIRKTADLLCVGRERLRQLLYKNE